MVHIAYDIQTLDPGGVEFAHEDVAYCFYEGLIDHLGHDPINIDIPLQFVNPKRPGFPFS